MNSGFNRDLATFTMNVPSREGGYEPRDFSTWAAIALAGIGDLPETVRDRSIEIEMMRKLPSERVNKLRRRDGGDLSELARKLRRWSDDNIAALQAAEPNMPEGLNDRAADAWEPLVAIADCAGGTWPAGARAVALALSGEDVASAKDEGIDTMLLSDIRDAFVSDGVNRLSGEDLTCRLTDLEGRPWAEWKNGKALTKNQLARRLKAYGIVSCALEFGNEEGRLKGYRRADFNDAFERYLPSPPISSRDLVISLEKSGETRDSQLVIPDAEHEFENAPTSSNSRRLHDFTSSSPHPVRASSPPVSGAPTEGPSREGEDMLRTEVEESPAWPGRAVL
jgi:putative DNA primase/helicase